MQQFGLGTEPILQFVTEPPAIIVKDLECSASDRVVGLLDLVEDIAGGGLFELVQAPWPAALLLLLVGSSVFSLICFGLPRLPVRLPTLWRHTGLQDVCLVAQEPSPMAGAAEGV